MNLPADWTGQQILVIGLARSGVAVAKQLSRLGADVTVNDQKPREQAPEASKLEQLGIRVICGGHPDGLVHRHLALVVKNPGVPYHIPPIQQAGRLNIPIVTEVEVAYALTAAPFVGITGSNGKTTTTTLVGKMLETSGVQHIVAGNIGRALTDVAADVSEDDWLIAELSSFQLKGTLSFRPRVAALLNIVSAHLDYHGHMDDYVRSKQNIFKNQTASDIAIFNADCAMSATLATRVKATVWMFSRQQQVRVGTDIRDGVICFSDGKHEVARILPVSEIALPGNHNLENALAAVAIAKACGCSLSGIRKALRQFKGVEHRLEFVREIDGVPYYNDSKATNPTAVIRTLQSFSTPIVLIAGGLDRGIDFRELIPIFEERVSALIVYGQAGPILYDRGRDAGVEIVRQAEDLPHAVDMAHHIARRNDVVVLSPACASWDQFASFEARGGIFKQAVHKLY